MTGLQAQSRKIQEVTVLIDEISARTNMLALNAAIETARAGESERGFAVVATEERSLAQRTKTATDEINLLLRGVYEQAKHAGSQTTNLSHNISDLTRTADALRTLFANIERLANASETEVHNLSDASKLNVVSAKSISAAANEIVASMQENVDSLPGVTASVVRLSENAEEMHCLTAVFDADTSHDNVRRAVMQAARNRKTVRSRNCQWTDQQRGTVRPYLATDTGRQACTFPMPDLLRRQRRLRLLTDAQPQVQSATDRRPCRRPDQQPHQTDLG